MYVEYRCGPGWRFIQYVVYMGGGKHISKYIQHLLFYQEGMKGGRIEE
jgi:hypothetical protein